MGKKNNNYADFMSATYFNFNSVIYLLGKTPFSFFKDITEERGKELDSLAETLRHRFSEQATNTWTLETIAADRLRISPEFYGAHTNDEKLYLFIKIVDPEFKALQFKRICKDDPDTFKQYCTNKFGPIENIDKKLYLLELYADKKLHILGDKNEDEKKRS